MCKGTSSVQELKKVSSVALDKRKILYSKIFIDLLLFGSTNKQQNPSGISFENSNGPVQHFYVFPKLGNAFEFFRIRFFFNPQQMFFATSGNLE